MSPPKAGARCNVRCHGYILVLKENLFVYCVLFFRFLRAHLVVIFWFYGSLKHNSPFRFGGKSIIIFFHYYLFGFYLGGAFVNTFSQYLIEVVELHEKEICVKIQIHVLT